MGVGILIRKFQPYINRNISWATYEEQLSIQGSFLHPFTLLMRLQRSKYLRNHSKWKSMEDESKKLMIIQNLLRSRAHFSNECLLWSWNVVFTTMKVFWQNRRPSGIGHSHIYLFPSNDVVFLLHIFQMSCPIVAKWKNVDDGWQLYGKRVKK